LDFFLNMFKSAFIHSIHLLAKGPLGMVFKHLQSISDPKDLDNDFSH
jgi:hypothetical protein